MTSDELIPRGSFDIAADYAQPLTGITTLRVIGMDPDEWRRYIIPLHKLAYRMGDEAQLARWTQDFLDGTTALGTAALDANHQAALSAQLVAGAHSITATFAGETSAALVVSVLATTTTTVQTSLSPSDPTQGVTFTATVAAVDVSGTPTGTVTFVVDNVSQTPVALSGGTATLSTSTLAAGSHSIGAVYSGDDTFATSSAAALSQTVSSKATSKTDLQSSGAPYPGQSLTFTATVTAVDAALTAIPSGTVTFSIDGAAQSPSVALANGVATFSTSTLSSGGSPHTIGATYNGDTVFGTSSASIQQSITSSASITSLDPAFGPDGGGTTVTLTGTGFTGAPAVSFGTTPATSFTVQSDTSITAIAPAGSGVVGVTVTVPAGTFTNAIQVRRERTDKPDYLRRYWLVPGVGKVREEGERTEELSSYDIKPQ